MVKQERYSNYIYECKSLFSFPNFILVCFLNYHLFSLLFLFLLSLLIMYKDCDICHLEGGLKATGSEVNSYFPISYTMVYLSLIDNSIVMPHYFHHLLFHYYSIYFIYSYIFSFISFKTIFHYHIFLLQNNYSST